MAQRPLNGPHQNFNQLIVHDKDPTKHTFYFADRNSYYYIPIFQQNSEIRFGDSTYEIIKLKRRTETALLYQIQKQDKDNKKILIEYQFIFDHTKQNENYKYYEDQTNNVNDKIKFRQHCRIAIIRDEENQQGVQLIRFIQLNNQHQENKIKLLDQLSKEQLQQIDYNQIFVDEKFNIQIRQKQQDVSCFVQAPVAISQTIPYQQTFLIGFYHSLLNNSTIFNQYLNREQNLQQYLKRSQAPLFLQQQIAGALKYNYKLQIPKNTLLKEIKQLDNKKQQDGSIEARQSETQLVEDQQPQPLSTSNYNYMLQNTTKNSYEIENKYNNTLKQFESVPNLEVLANLELKNLSKIHLVELILKYYQNQEFYKTINQNYPLCFFPFIYLYNSISYRIADSVREGDKIQTEEIAATRRQLNFQREGKLLKAAKMIIEQQEATIEVQDNHGEVVLRIGNGVVKKGGQYINGAVQIIIKGGVPKIEEQDQRGAIKMIIEDAVVQIGGQEIKGAVKIIIKDQEATLEVQDKSGEVILRMEDGAIQKGGYDIFAKGSGPIEEKIWSNASQIAIQATAVKGLFGQKSNDLERFLEQYQNMVSKFDQNNEEQILNFPYRNDKHAVGFCIKDDVEQRTAELGQNKKNSQISHCDINMLLLKSLQDDKKDFTEAIYSVSANGRTRCPVSQLRALKSHGQVNLAKNPKEMFFLTARKKSQGDYHQGAALEKNIPVYLEKVKGNHIVLNKLKSFLEQKLEYPNIYHLEEDLDDINRSINMVKQNTENNNYNPLDRLNMQYEVNKVIKNPPEPEMTNNIQKPEEIQVNQKDQNTKECFNDNEAIQNIFSKLNLKNQNDKPLLMFYDQQEYSNYVDLIR